MSRKTIDDTLEERLERLAAIGERQLPQVKHLVPTSLTRRERKALEADAKFVSLRAYRRALDQVIAWALLGKMSTRAAQELAQTIRIASELMMSEHILTASGRGDIEPEHLDGEHGGAPVMPTEAPEYIETTVERRTGVGPRGEPIDETVVTARGSKKLASGTALTGPALADPPPTGQTVDLSLLPQAFHEDD